MTRKGHFWCSADPKRTGILGEVRGVGKRLRFERDAAVVRNGVVVLKGAGKGSAQKGV
jgi:hypothetical protein